ncbi:FtsX-like permease family protein [Nocardioides sp. T2.26MG-1]|uniref:FtsX-like permease family protein n=1 Tax=Nocardioides sp. T2.26MG-1 TaxID=3041166 RepID=UPI0024777895|nr:FtsX-like permease family protein [Nocardioides sp. T2.26MG-1]CAI9413445.1 hypothetical protein HIDPHFAB_02022 [Nocardioides sp. T2.26MG-1]
MSVRYRPFQALALAALAALVTACAVFAPLYDRAMQQALTDITVERADPDSVALQVSTGSDSLFSNAKPENLVALVSPAMRDSYLDPVLGYRATAEVLPGQPNDPLGDLVWRDGECDHVAFVRGDCPAAPGDIAVSTADADNFGLRVGRRLTIRPASGDVGSRLRVTGIYEGAQGDDYWLGLALTGRSGLADPGLLSQVQHDVWLTDRSTFEGSRVPVMPEQAATVGLPLDATALGVDDLMSLASGIEELAAAGTAPTAPFTVEVHSGLPDIAADVRDQTDQSRVTVPLLMAQLGLLALVVLWLTLLAVTEQRRPEVALARLRGRGRRGARSLLAGELLPVALGGVLPGVTIALVGTALARTVALPGHAPFESGLRLLVAVGIAVAALVLLTVLAITRVAREPVETLLRRVPPRRGSWMLGTGDALVVAGAGSLVVVFATGGLDGPVALAAPGLIAVVVGLVLAHLTTPLAAVTGRGMLRRGKVRAAVSLLDAARSPATRRVVAIVTLASALAVFSADAFVIGQRNRAAASEQQAGARLVADVEAGHLAAVRDALAEVDPDGRDATPVVRIRPPGVGSVETVAVVPDDFRRIALFPGGAPPAGTWRLLDVPDVDPLEITGTQLALTVAGSSLAATRADGQPGPLSLGVDLVTAAGETLHTTLGSLDRPVDRERLVVPTYCRDGCFVSAIWLHTLPGASITGSATLRDLRGDAPASIGPADQWTPVDDDAQGRMAPGSTKPRQLSVAVQTDGASEIRMPQVWLPVRAPALLTGGLPPAASGRQFDLSALDGTVQRAEEVQALDRVPGTGPRAALVNLDLVERGVALATSARIEIWFAEDDPGLLAKVTSALEERGASISTTSTLTETRRTFDDSAAAWSIQLAAVVGAAAVLLALLVLLVGAASSWRSRTRDLAALRMSGVPRRDIGSMAVASQLPAVVVGVIAGTATGVYGAHLALPTVPLFAGEPAVSTLDLSTAWPAVALAVVASTAVLGGGSALIGRVLARRAAVRRLREGDL